MDKNKEKTVLDFVMGLINISWVTLRYYAAETESFQKPVLMGVKNKDDDLELKKLPVDTIDVEKLIFNDDVLDEYILCILSFSFLVPVNGVPTIGFCHLAYSKEIGIISCYFTTKKGCQYVKQIVDIMNKPIKDKKATFDIYSKNEEPVEDIKDTDTGFIVITVNQDFRIYKDDDNFITLDEIDERLREESSIQDEESEEESEVPEWI